MERKYAAGGRQLLHAIISLLIWFVVTNCTQAVAPQDTPVVAEPTPTVEISPAPSATPVPDPTATVSPTPARAQNDFTVVNADISLSDDGGIFEEMLRFAPDNADTRGLAWVQDLRPWWSALESLGGERPGADSPDDAVSELLRNAPITDAFRARPWVEAPVVCCDTNYLRTYNPYPYMGFDLRSADQTLLIDKDGRIRYEAAFGFYDPDLTATRLEACDECIQPEAIDYHEVKYYSWGEDFTPNLRRRFEPPMFDSIGRGGRVAVGDGYALRTHHTQGMEDMIGAMNGDLPSLANSDDYELAARALVGMNAYAAGFRSHGLSLEEFQMDCQCDTDEISLEERVNSATSTPLMEHFTVAAAGYAFDDPDDSAYSVIALVHNDEASAQTNAERFEERLRVEYPAIENIFPTPNWGGALERVEIAVDGRVLLARLYREPATSGATHIHAPSILRRGGPLMHD